MNDETLTPDERSRSKPESFRSRMMAVSITADDARASLRWYRDVVGFTVDQEWEEDGELQGASLVAGNARIMLSQDDGAKGWDRTKGEGMRLHLTTVQDVDVLADRIRAAGGTLASEPADAPWGGRAFDLEDPDGFKITISDWAGEEV